MALSISVNTCLQSRFTLAKSSRLPTTRYAKFAIASRGNRSFQEVGLRGKDCETLSQGNTARPTTRFLVSRTAVNRDVGTDLTSNNAGNGLLWLATVSAASITLAVVDVLDGPGYAVLASGLLAGCFAAVVMMGWREKLGSASSISEGSVGRWTPPSAGEPAAAESPTGGEPAAKASAGDNLLQASGEPKGAQPGAAEAAGASSMVMRAEASKGVGSGAAGGAEAAGAVPAKAAGNEQGGGPSEEEPEGPPGGGGAADIVSEPQNPVSSAGTMMVSLGSQQVRPCPEPLQRSLCGVRPFGSAPSLLVGAIPSLSPPLTPFTPSPGPLCRLPLPAAGEGDGGHRRGPVPGSGGDG